MQKGRHHIFQQMASALAHQQEGHAELALAYWENVLRGLPPELRIHTEILAECDRIAQASETDRAFQKSTELHAAYVQHLSEEETRTFQAVYRAMVQQSGGNAMLACVYWQNAIVHLPPPSFVVTLGVQDFCWSAHQYLQAGDLKKCLQVYEQMVRVFPDFIEGYINQSLLQVRTGSTVQAIQLLRRVPPRYRSEFIIVRYLELYEQIAELSQQFNQVPYAAIESLVSDLGIENTFYPGIYQEYFAQLVTELINREKRFFEQRRKTAEEKAISKTSARLAQEGIGIGQRVTMAKEATSSTIPEFLNDNHVLIAEAILNNPNTTGDDVVFMAQISPVGEVLSCIARHWKWKGLHSIVMALLYNPQTLPRDSYRLLDQITINDLARVFYKRNIPAEIRLRAKGNLQEQFNQLSLYDKVAMIEASSGDILKLLDGIQIDLPLFLEQLVDKFPIKPDIIMNISRWKYTPVTVLSTIGTNPQFTADIRIKFALLSNPRTPKQVVTDLVQSLNATDAEDLLLNKYISACVKQAISEFFHEISE